MLKYESVFKFIEESMPQLKRVQQENMRIQVQKIIFQLKQDISKMLANEWLGAAAIASDFSASGAMNEKDTRKITQQEYDDKISRCKSEYLKLWQLIQKLNGKLNLSASED